MSKTLLALVLLLVVVPATSALPPEGSSGQMIRDEVPELRVEVARREREIARSQDKDEVGLAEARARLAEAEGRIDAAVKEWRTAVDLTEKRYQRFMNLVRRGVFCGSSAELLIERGDVAKYRIRLAELEGKPSVVADELPKLIAGLEAHLAAINILVTNRAMDDKEAELDTKRLRKELRSASSRLDAVKRLAAEKPATKANQ
jgi:hypothetical protein